MTSVFLQRRLAALLLFGFCTASLSAQTRRYPALRCCGNYTHNYLLAPVGNTTPWGLSWSPDGASLVTSFAGSLWRVDQVTGAAYELTDGPKYYGAPDWSPDGKWIVLTADDGGKTVQIEMLNVATGERKALTTDDQVYVDPRFSSDGAWLTYTATRPTGYLNVFVRPVRDGAWAGDEIQVTSESKTNVDRAYFTRQDMFHSSTWLHGTNELLLLSNRGVILGSGSVVRARASANAIDSARVLLAEQTLYQAKPDVSPDGRRFVYSSAKGGVDPINSLYVRDVDGESSTRVTHLAYDAFMPRWSPDGKSVAFLSNESGLPRLAVLDLSSGSVRAINIGARTWKRLVGTVHVRVIDEGTGTMTAARVGVTASDGRFYGPEDHFARITWAGDRVFQSPGEFTMTLPAGAATIDVVKGFEHTPRRVVTTIDPGKTTELTVRLPVLVDMRARGWCSGSTGVHINGGGPLRNDPYELLRTAAAEDLTVVANPMAHMDSQMPLSALWTPGRPASPLSTPKALLIYGQEQRPAFHGHIAEFGMRDHIETLIPVTVGYEQQFTSTLLPTNTDILRRAKAQGAFTAYVHAFVGETDPMTQALGLAKSFMIDAALGTTDGIEWASSGRGAFVPWYAALNNGLPITALGGEDTIINLYIMRLAGAVRTYAACSPTGGLTPDAWFASAKAGKSFVTTGPLVELSVNGRGPGEHVKLSSRGGDVRVHGWVRSITPLQKVLLVQDGEVLKEITLDSTRSSAEFTTTVKVTRSGWFHLRAEGSGPERAPLDALYAQAFTNPVWVDVGTQPVRSRAAAEYSLKWLDQYQLLADAWPGWTSEAERKHLARQVDEARARYQRFALEDRRKP